MLTLQWRAFIGLCARAQGVAVVGSQQRFVCRTQVVHSGDIICEGIIRIQKEPVKAELPREEQPAAQNAVEAEPIQDPAGQPSRRLVKSQPTQKDSAKGMTKVRGSYPQTLHTKPAWCKSYPQWDCTQTMHVLRSGLPCGLEKAMLRDCAGSCQGLHQQWALRHEWVLQAQRSQAGREQCDGVGNA